MCTEKILVADDDPAVRRLVIEVVTGRGRVLVEATNEEETLKSCMGGGFSVLSPDHLMPGLTGLDIIRDVRKSGDIGRVSMTETPLYPGILPPAGGGSLIRSQ
jgi:CheY-like chemotaxis protein